MATETDVSKLQRMRAECQGWRGEVLDDAIAELVRLRAAVHTRGPTAGHARNAITECATFYAC